MPTTTTETQRILTEHVLSLKEARDEIKAITGQRPDKSTIGRWIHRGAGGAKLSAIRLGDRLFTSREAITRFIEARTNQ